MQVHTALNSSYYAQPSKNHVQNAALLMVISSTFFLKIGGLKQNLFWEKKNYLKGKMKMSVLARGSPKIFSIIRRDLCSISLFYVLYSIEQVPL